MARTSVALSSLTAALSACAASAADLTDLSFESLLETRVTTASKYEQTLVEVPAAVSVITRDDIRAYGWRTLAEALASLPGIHVSYDRQYVYAGTRGFGLPGDFNTRLLVAVNGNRVNDVVYDSGGLGRDFPVDLDLIERIEFIPGPGGAVYGQNAMFGVVNVITRNGLQVDGWEMAASYQQPQEMHEGRLRLGRRLADGTDVLFALSAARAQGEDLYMTFPGAAADGSDFSGVARGLDGETDEELLLHLGRGAWNFDARYGSRRKDDPTAGYFSDPLAPGQYERDDDFAAQLQYQRDLTPGWNLLGRAFTGSHRYSGLYLYEGAPNYSTGISAWHGAELRLLHTGFARHKLMFGVELQDNRRIDQTAEDLSAPAPLQFGFPVSTPLVIERDGHRAGFYVQDEWELGARLSSSLGVRMDRNDSTGTRLSPRAALIWKARPALTLKALYGRANRAPNRYERDYDDGAALVANPALGRESIDTAELVADAQVADGVALRASLYRWHVHHLIQLGTEPGSGVPQYQSRGKAAAQGAELTANAAWNSGARLRASVSWQDASYAGGAALPNSPQWLARVNYTRPLSANYDLGLEMQYDGERRTRAGTMLGAYWIGNVNLVASGFASGLEMALTLMNLFDRRLAQPAAESNWQDSFEQDGRAVRLRVDYRF